MPGKVAACPLKLHILRQTFHLNECTCSLVWHSAAAVTDANCSYGTRLNHMVCNKTHTNSCL